MECKYGCGLGGWCSKVVKGGYGVGLWKFIRLGGVLFPGFFHSWLGMEPVFVFGLIGGAVMGL